MNPKITRVIALLAALTSIGAFADDDYFKLRSDASYLDAEIESNRSVFYSGNTLDVRVVLKGDTSTMAANAVELYLSIVDPSGYTTFERIQDYQTFNSRRLVSIPSIAASTDAAGAYQLAIIAVKPGGNPALVTDWFNGYSGLLDQEALYLGTGAVSNDDDGDGFWDNDYDRDGYYGDEDTLYKNYYNSSGTLYSSSSSHDWNDDDWDDDNDSNDKDDD